MKKNSAIAGAAFLMATSAIGPGFLTQTSKFTADLLTSFGFVILISVLLDIGAQVNIWRIIAVSGKRAQDIANEFLPGLGVFLACLIGFGGLVFNIGNIGGTGLGFNAVTGLDARLGAGISCVIALAIFWYREAGLLVDGFVKWLGIIMILFTIYIAFSSAPPLKEALYRTFWPEKIDLLKIITLVGGTVGGYISFAGAHRLLDAGISGKASLSVVTGSAIRGILLTSFMRYLLFLAALGVVWQGAVLSADNPAASVFQNAAGNIGYRFFGIVMWCAAITSVIGASYTSISFFKTLHPFIAQHHKVLVSLFILLSTIIFMFMGNPVQLLILAGAVNGMILPIALALLLLATRSRKMMKDYQHPFWMKLAGWLVVATVTWMGVVTIINATKQLYS